jgi:hypothetical protein
MRITLPDSLVDQFQVYADRQGVPVETVITTALTKVADVEPGVRSLTLSGDLLDEVESLVGRLPCKNTTDLVAKIKMLAGITFRHTRLDFSASQLRELEHQASRQGVPVKVLADRIIQTILTQFFWHMSGPAATPTPQVGVIHTTKAPTKAH